MQITISKFSAGGWIWRCRLWFVHASPCIRHLCCRCVTDLPITINAGMLHEGIYWMQRLQKNPLWLEYAYQWNNGHNFVGCTFFLSHCYSFFSMLRILDLWRWGQVHQPYMFWDLVSMNWKLYCWWTRLVHHALHNYQVSVQISLLPRCWLDFAHLSYVPFGPMQWKRTLTCTFKWNMCLFS